MRRHRTSEKTQGTLTGVGVLLSSLSLILSACGGGGAADLTDGPEDPEDPSGDQTAPTISITSPAPGSAISSGVTIIVSAADQSGIAVVRFFVDEELIAEDFDAPYEADWTAAPGNYTVRAEAIDGSDAENANSVTASYTVLEAGGNIPQWGQWNDEDFTVVHEVGPGKQHTELSDVPWETIGPDTLVRVHWRSEPYRAKWVLDSAGTSSSPIVVVGMPNGNLRPVISGEDAVTRSQLSFPNEERSIIKIGGSDASGNDLAEWIFIENLDIEGANPENRFTTSDGGSASYASNAAAIHVQLGQNIYIRGNILRNSGNGLFSGFQSSNLVISGNRFEDNGNVGSASQHNSYTESLGIIYEFNWFRPLRSGASGNNLKDRSAGTVVRYNWIESGSRQLDLVDSDHANIYGSPEYASTFVYGNVFIEPANSTNGNIVHYGGDLSGREDTYRKGTLYFYNNTIVSFRTDRTVLFGMSSNDEAADARNNLYYSPEGGNTLAITSGRGLIDLRGNWLQSGWDASSETLTGTVNDFGNTEASDPSFADEATMNFRLTAGSDAVGAGVGPASATAGHPVDQQYEEHQRSGPRTASANMDAGAFGFDGDAQPVPAITTHTLPDGEPGVAYSEFLTANDGTLPFTWQVSGGTLPDGLSLNAETGEISGTPEGNGSETFTVTVVDANQQEDSAVLTLDIVEDVPDSDSVLDDYSASSALQALPFVSGDLSGITYVPDTNTFFLVQNNGGGIWEVDSNFNNLRKILLSGAGDTEDIVYLGNNEFALVDESSQLLIGTIGPNTTQVSAGDFQRIQFDSYSGNSGYEGITYDAILKTFYVVKESSPKRIRSFVRPSTSADTMVDADTPFNAEQLPASDLSAVSLDSRTGRLLILSHESHKLMDVGLDGFVYGELTMADSSQQEGIALDSSFNIYVTSEPQHYRVYSQQ
jgi:uncharacterized protein YjiK